jgi:hypothetical protein
MFSGYRVTTTIVADYNEKSLNWVGTGLVLVEKTDITDGTMSEEFVTEAMVADTSDEVFDLIATRIEELLGDSTALI